MGRGGEDLLGILQEVLLVRSIRDVMPGVYLYSPSLRKQLGGLGKGEAVGALGHSGAWSALSGAGGGVGEGWGGSRVTHPSW